MHTTSTDNASGSKPASAAFWQNPPWQQAGGFRLGLQPVGFENWCPNSIDAVELSRKAALLDQAQPQVCCSAVSTTTAQEQVSQWLTAQHPLPTELPLSPATLRGLESAQALTLARCALSVPEDLCIMTRDGDNYRLSAACVCAPSYWYLPEKIGRLLHQIHAPVSGLNDKIGGMIQQFMHRLPGDRLFLRRNWFIHQSPELYQPDAETVPSAKIDVAELQTMVVRSETQTLRRIDDDNVLFTILVSCYPLTGIADYPSAAKAMRDSIATFNEDEYSSFGLDRLGDALQTYLATIAGQ